MERNRKEGETQRADPWSNMRAPNEGKGQVTARSRDHESLLLAFSSRMIMPITTSAGASPNKADSMARRNRRRPAAAHHSRSVRRRLGAFDHLRTVSPRPLRPLRPLRTLRALPIGRSHRRGGALLRYTPAQVERALDGKAFLFLPGDLAPSFIASAVSTRLPPGIFATISLPVPGAARRLSVDADIGGLRQRGHGNACNGEPQHMRTNFMATLRRRRPVKGTETFRRENGGK